MAICKVCNSLGQSLINTMSFMIVQRIPVYCTFDNDFTEASELLGDDNKGSVSCAAENEVTLNGDITPADDKPVSIVNNKTDNGPKPSAERCRLSETGDQLYNDVGSPLSATSPLSENGGECCENEDCSGVGMFSIALLADLCT